MLFVGEANTSAGLTFQRFNITGMRNHLKKRVVLVPTEEGNSHLN